MKEKKISCPSYASIVDVMLVLYSRTDIDMEQLLLCIDKIVKLSIQQFGMACLITCFSAVKYQLKHVLVQKTNVYRIDVFNDNESQTIQFCYRQSVYLPIDFVVYPKTNGQEK